MRIKSAKQAYTLLHSGIVPASGYTPKVQSGGKNSAVDELMWELAIVTSPCKQIDELPRELAEYIYTENPKEERLYYLKSKICTAVDDYSLSFIKNNTVEKYWKITRLNQMTVEDFRETERCGRRLHNKSFYYLSIGIDDSNYYKLWRKKVDEVNNYLDCLLRRANSPVDEKIEELRDRESLDKTG